MAHLQGLNDAQSHAVTTEAAVVQVLAPPGSGKTKTLTARVAHLLQDEGPRLGYRPWDVICLTFTIKSAREMKERLGRLIGDDTAKRVILGTFHSVCRRYLATYGHLIGLKKHFGIADSNDSIAIVKRIVKRCKLSLDPKQARERISKHKTKNEAPQDVRRLAMARTAKRRPQDVIDMQEFITAYSEYEDHLAASNLLDFDDLLLRGVKLLQQHPTCVRNVKTVLIDEFQDTNYIQFDLMRLFAQHCQRITTVGDPDQSIYGWRNAEVGNLTKTYELWPDTVIVNLKQNYRSAGRILEAAQAVIEQDPVRPQKSLLATHRQGTHPVLRLLPKPASESEWIVSEIQRCITLSAGLLTHSDVAILLRSLSLSRQIESSMGSAGIPYRMVGGKKFFERIEIKILVDYLRTIAQPDNSDALSRILNVPSRRIGETTIKNLLAEATTRECTLWGIVQKFNTPDRKTTTRITGAQAQGLSTLARFIQKARTKLEHEDINPKALLDYILEKLNFKEHLEKEYKEDHESRWDNVEQLLIQADDPAYHASNEIPEEERLPELEDVEQIRETGAASALQRFLANIALAAETENEKDEENGGKRDAVTISTMHAAKGLEWPIVFVPACYTGSMPHSRAEDMDEERRLLYVAMTRAKAMLYHSVPLEGFSRDQNEISRFLDDGKVRTKLVNQAPLLDYDTIGTIASILGRDKPSYPAMADAMKQLDRITDDYWPTDGSYPREKKDTEFSWSSANDNTAQLPSGGAFKRQRLSNDLSAKVSTVNSTVYHRTTMENRETLNGPTSVGFTTAAQQMQLQCEQVLQAEKTLQDQTDPTEARKKGQRLDNIPSKPRTTKRPAGQSSLLGWYQSTSGESDLNYNMLISEGDLRQVKYVETLKNDISIEQGNNLIQSDRRNNISTSSTHPDSTAISSAESMSSRAIQGGRVPMQSINANRPFRPVIPSGRTAPFRRPLNGMGSNDNTGNKDILLSSSPPREVAEVPEDASQSSMQSNSKQYGSRTEFRTASTLHCTTLGRVADERTSYNNYNSLGSKQGGTAQRRRLGMGGPMKPWKP